MRSACAICSRASSFAGGGALKSDCASQTVCVVLESMFAAAFLLSDGLQRKPSEVVVSRQSTAKSRISPDSTVTPGSSVFADAVLTRSRIHSASSPFFEEISRALTPSPLPAVLILISPAIDTSPASGASQRLIAALLIPRSGWPPLAVRLAYPCCGCGNALPPWYRLDCRS